MRLLPILLFILFLTTACIFQQADFDINNKAEIEQEEINVNQEIESILETKDQNIEEDEKTAEGDKNFLEKAGEAVKEIFISDKPEEDELPSTFNADVDFAPQAPFANWDMPYKEACEEASMIMAVRYFKEQALNESIMKDEILKLVDWEENQGYKVDMTAAEVAQAIEDYFNSKAELSYEVAVDKIKEELVKGKLIIIPAAGRQLGNPYFQQPGPLYHMLVITGYDRDEFITNDPGTKRGEGFKYKYQTLINAIHDWNDGDVDNGQKVMILVSK